MGDLNLDYPDLVYRSEPNMSREGAAGFSSTNDPTKFAPRPYENPDFPVYRGREVIRPYDLPNTTVYRGREVIRPLEVPSTNPYIEDGPPQDNGL